jgi:hypothetical protein
MKNAVEYGPLYGTELIETLPIGTGPMVQAMPSLADLEQVKRSNQRVVAGYEVLLAHYRDLRERCERFVNANRSEHLAVRLSDDEMEAFESIKRYVECSR